MRPAGEHQTPQGEDSNLSKLTNEQIRYIRNEPTFETVAQLARKFGVHRTLIWQIRTRKVWRALSD